MISVLNASALPGGFWGFWVVDPQSYAFPATISVSATSVTQASGIFEGMVEFFAKNSKEKTVKTWNCPGSTNIKLDADLQQIRFRFRAFANGFQVRVTVNDHMVMVRPQDDTTTSIKKYPLHAMVM